MIKLLLHFNVAGVVDCIKLVILDDTTVARHFLRWPGVFQFFGTASFRNRSYCSSLDPRNGLFLPQEVFVNCEGHEVLFIPIQSFCRKLNSLLVGPVLQLQGQRARIGVEPGSRASCRSGTDGSGALAATVAAAYDHVVISTVVDLGKNQTLVALA